MANLILLEDENILLAELSDFLGEPGLPHSTSIFPDDIVGSE